MENKAHFVPLIHPRKVQYYPFKACWVPYQIFALGNNYLLGTMHEKMLVGGKLTNLANCESFIFLTNLKSIWHKH